MDYKILQERMIERQIKARGVTGQRVIRAIRKYPRHKFVPEQDADYAYDDTPLSIGHGQTISQPYIVAYMTEQLEVDNNMRVLEIGTGSGYQAALLSWLAKEVYSVERIEPISKRAGKIFKKLDIGNIKQKVGDGSEGWPEYAPYDRIIFTGAMPGMPEELESQVNKEDGIILAPVGSSLGQRLVKIRYVKGKRSVEDKIGCVFVSIYGKHGF